MKRLVIIKDKTIEVVKVLTNDESELITNHIISVSSLHERVFQIMQVVKIYDEIKVSLSNDSNYALNRLIREFFSNFSSFIDYWEKRLSHDFGNKSQQYLDFENTTHAMYDNVFPYRFACMFRNYMEHYEMPYISFSKKLDNNNNVIDSLLLSCQKLLDNSFNWKHVRTDLQNLKHEIDLLILFPIIIKSIERINDISLSFYDIEETLKSCKIILDYEQLRKDGSELAIAIFADNYPSDLSCTIERLFPFNMAKYFLKQIVINE
jgi:hypothetical protein